MKTPLFPTLKQTLTDFIEDEEGAIPAGNLLTIGAMVVVLSTILESEALAKHRSHSSHSSHSSSSYVRGHGSHTSAAYTRSHGSHASHSSSVTAPSSTYTPSYASPSSSYTPSYSSTPNMSVDAASSIEGDGSKVAPIEETKLSEEAKAVMRRRINSLTWATPQSAPENVDIPSVEEILKLETPESSSFNEIVPALASPLDTPKHDVALPALQKVPETPDLLNRD